MLRLIRLIEKVFVVVSLLIFSGAILPILNQARGIPANEKDPLTQVIFLGIRLGIIFLAIVWHKRIVRIALKEKLLSFMVGGALISVCWSVAPVETLNSAIGLGISTLFGVYLAARYSLKEQLWLLACTLGIAGLLSLFVALVLPSYGVMGMGYFLNVQEVGHKESWKGIYGHKNTLGQIMSLGALVFLLLSQSSGRYKWITWVGFGLSVSLILMSTSKTALVVCLAMIALIPLYRVLQWNSTFAVYFFISLILVGIGLVIFLLNNLETILTALGRDTKLSGRTLLWAVLLNKIWERPWLGYGYGGFWLGLNGESAEVSRIVGWDVAHAHNGFLDLWLNIGLLGLTIFLFSYLKKFVQAVTYARYNRNAEGIWPLAYLIFLLLVNISESTIISNQPISWILYVSCYSGVKKYFIPLNNNFSSANKRKLLVGKDGSYENV